MPNSDPDGGKNKLFWKVILISGFLISFLMTKQILYRFVHTVPEGGKAARDVASDMGGRYWSTVRKIRASYLVTVKPIFSAKCFDCHNAQIAAPWYGLSPAIFSHKISIINPVEADKVLGLQKLDLQMD